MGMAEVIKYGVTLDSELFKIVRDGDLDRLRSDWVWVKNVIYRSIKAKNNIVLKDPIERRGIRTVLNYGHTVGHALELIDQLKLRHGEAVSLGMMIECMVSREINSSYCPKHVEDELENVLNIYKLPTKINNIDRYIDIVIRNMTDDKKIYKNMLKIPAVIDIGKHTVIEVPTTRYISLVKKFLEKQ
jgi:3-dehydroquinate synthase